MKFGCLLSVAGECRTIYSEVLLGSSISVSCPDGMRRQLWLIGKSSLSVLRGRWVMKIQWRRVANSDRMAAERWGTGRTRRRCTQTTSGMEFEVAPDNDNAACCHTLASG